MFIGQVFSMECNKILLLEGKAQSAYYVFVWIWAGTEFIFFLIDNIVLCYGFVRKTVLTHQCFRYY